MNRNGRHARRGFTLIEMMVTAVIGAISVAAAFSFARFQVLTYATQADGARLHATARVVFDGLARDLRNASYGMSFYAGMEATSFGGDLHVVDSGDASSRGLPAVRLANNITGPVSVVPGAGVMPGSDALMVLRVTSNATRLVQGIMPCAASTATDYPIDDFTVLQQCAANQGLVLVSDSTRPTGESESMLLPIQSVSAAGMRLRVGYGIDPTSVSRCTNKSVPPGGAGVGARISCVQPVTYWVDNLARLRMWRPQSPTVFDAPDDAVGPTYAGHVPIDPANDLVLAEGVEDLQVAGFMSREAPMPLTNAWAFASTAIVPGNEEIFAEVRILRISAVLRTIRALNPKEAIGLPVDAFGAPTIEDHSWPNNPVLSCGDVATCYDPSYQRKVVTFEAELRNMRIFDLLSDSTRTAALVRSYRP